jgi:hypothetical protein
MKKLALTIVVVLGLGLTTFANDGGLFQRGASEPTSGLYGDRDGGLRGFPGLPGHGETGNQDAPLGSGVAVLLGLGAAYMVAKKRKED